MSKSEAMVFTIHNYTDEDWERIKGIDCRCLIMQQEICPETGKAHIQGYIEWKSRTEFKRAHTLLDATDNAKTPAWIKAAKGGYEDNVKYCNKSETRKPNTEPFKKGEGKKKGQGHRSDLDQAAKMVFEKKPLAEIAHEMPTTYIRNFKGLHALEFITTPDRVEAPFLFYVYGASGVGKSRSIREYHGANNVYVKTDDGKTWFDGLSPRHEVLVLDEFTGQTRLSEINRWADWGACQCEIKGGYVKLNVKYIYIVSNFTIEDIYRNKAPQEYEPLLRRIREMGDIIEVKAQPDGSFVNFITKYWGGHPDAVPPPQAVDIALLEADNNADYEAPGLIYPPPGEYVPPQHTWESEQPLPDTQPMPLESQIDDGW